METIVRKIFIGFRPLCTVFHPVMPAGQLFYRAYGRDENVFLLTVPALVQNVINNGVLSGAVYGNFKVNARLSGGYGWSLFPSRCRRTSMPGCHSFGGRYAAPTGESPDPSC